MQQYRVQMLDVIEKSTGCVLEKLANFYLGLEKKTGSQFTSLKLTPSRTCWQERRLQNLPGHREADKKHKETTPQPGRCLPSSRCAAPTCSSRSTKQKNGNHNSTATPVQLVAFSGRFFLCFFLLFCSSVCFKCVCSVAGLQRAAVWFCIS